MHMLLKYALKIREAEGHHQGPSKPRNPSGNMFRLPGLKCKSGGLDLRPAIDRHHSNHYGSLRCHHLGLRKTPWLRTYSVGYGGRDLHVGIVLHLVCCLRMSNERRSNSKIHGWKNGKAAGE